MNGRSMYILFQLFLYNVRKWSRTKCLETAMLGDHLAERLLKRNLPSGGRIWRSCCRNWDDGLNQEFQAG